MLNDQTPCSENNFDIQMSNLLSTNAKYFLCPVLKCEDLLLYSFLFNSKLNIFGFWSVDQYNKLFENIPFASGNLSWAYFSIFDIFRSQILNKMRQWGRLINNEHNHFQSFSEACSRSALWGQTLTLPLI